MVIRLERGRFPVQPIIGVSPELGGPEVVVRQRLELGKQTPFENPAGGLFAR